ncbi:hypothetical protein [Fictibacillus phosphorivorans]|uniref:hypothetical protein n=1 Tax=Fictibacillus phosphorivorans TaxID=1221500 RepID=UPI00203D6256|nr:hypothetical protein [Fictibacillus phosphorivorans]MCM3718032.1 hypothetical protein [Fictibacillus phosphorivorans]MCM3775481.1 hypothetical protein [Fictibacillus phosphorivorans]
MENQILLLSWSLIGYYLAIFFCVGLLLYFTANMIKKDTRIIDYFTNVLIVIGAIAWVVITS